MEQRTVHRQINKSEPKLAKHHSKLESGLLQTSLRRFRGKPKFAAINRACWFRGWSKGGIMWAPSWGLLGASCVWDHLGPFWGHLGSILEPFWSILGPPWVHLGSILVHLGASLGHLGAPKPPDGSGQASATQQPMRQVKQTLHVLLCYQILHTTTHDICFLFFARNSGQTDKPRAPRKSTHGPQSVEKHVPPGPTL